MFHKNKNKTFMKKIKYIVFLLLYLLVSFISCDDMNDIQSKFADREEQVYLGKVDSIEYFPGNGRVKLTWYVSSDPKIDKTIIYWNMRNDSIIKEFNRSTSGVQKDSVIIDNLSEGTTLFEFKNVSNSGESSLYSMSSVPIWGTRFGDGLYSRRIVQHNYVYDESIYELGLSSVFEGDSVVFSEIMYTDQNGKNTTLRIERDIENIVLSDFPDGGEFKLRTAFFPPQGIDTIFNNYQTFNVPHAVFGSGNKISLKGNLSSRYFERYGSLYEWNSDGDISVYLRNDEGEYHLDSHYPSVVSRATFREFFFYDDDKYVGISTDSRISMHQIIDGQLVTILTPNGEATFGSGFTMERFMAGRGFFYALRNDGRMYLYLLNNNATFGDPRLTSVSTDFRYDLVLLYNYNTLLGVSSDGRMYAIPITTNGVLGNKSTIGTGWNKFKKLVSVGEKLLCFDENGDIYEFDFNTTNYYWIIE